jgi:hypothetical protein
MQSAFNHPLKPAREFVKELGVDLLEIERLCKRHDDLGERAPGDGDSKGMLLLGPHNVGRLRALIARK